jgi:hypothetical protein
LGDEAPLVSKKNRIIQRDQDENVREIKIKINKAQVGLVPGVGDFGYSEIS